MLLLMVYVTVTGFVIYIWYLIGQILLLLLGCTLLLLRMEIEEGTLRIIVVDDGISNRSIIVNEPYVGQIFDSIDDAKSFYMYYGGKVGFSVHSFSTKYRMDKNT